MAEEFNFTYLSRDDRSFFKKAGNILHGFKNSSSEFIAIFDADFCPRPDFLDELLPYFDKHPNIGIVQTPQYFDVHEKQNWLERGAGAVQEYFYRSIQQNRHIHGGAICVGSNAVYRRAALNANQGPTLIEHSEDVHTGFDLKAKGWELIYLPIILAKGICPNDIRSFFRQQYRWCKGSMSLLFSKKFWKANLTIKQRFCFFSGFFYYIHTAISTLILPLIPPSLIYIVPEQARILNYVILLPSFIYAGIIFPLWHKTSYRWETLAVKMIYGWAHLFAIADTLRRKGMSWHPTGSINNKSLHFNIFQALLCTFSLPVTLLWIGGAAFYMITWNFWDFLPTFIAGILYGSTVTRVCVAAFKPYPYNNTILRKYGFFLWILFITASSFTIYTAHAGYDHDLSTNEQLQTTSAITLQTITPSPKLQENTSNIPQEFTILAQRGDSLYTLARKAVAEANATQHLSLKPWESMFIETELVQTKGYMQIDTGTSVTFEQKEIDRIMNRIPSQTTAQITTWTTYAYLAKIR